MTQDTYRFAYEEANADLLEIVKQYEQLQLRKSQVELVLEALRPVLSDEPMAAVSSIAAMSVESPVADVTPFLVQASEITEPTEQIEAQSSIESEPEPEYAEQSSDPFQRRIDNALRHGFGGRDSRVLSLGLNGLLTRA